MNNVPEPKLKVVTIRLFEADFEFMKDRFPNSGHNKAIRQVIRLFVKKMREKESVAIDAVGDIELPPDIEGVDSVRNPSETTSEPAG